MDKYRLDSHIRKKVIKETFHTYISSEKKTLIFVTALILFALFLELCIPVYLEEIINIFVYKKTDTNVTISICKLLCTFVFLAIAEIHKNKIMAKLAEKLGKNLREKVFGGFVSMSCGDMDKYNHGDLMSRLVNDIEKISSVIDLYDMLLSTSVMTIGTMVLMLSKNMKLAAVSLVVGLISFLLIKILSGVMRDCYFEQQIEIGALTTDIEEVAKNSKTIDNTNSHSFFFGRVKRQSEKFKKIRQKTMIINAILPSAVLILGNLNCILLIFLGYDSVVEGIVTIGALQSIIMYSKQFMESVNMLGDTAIKIQGFFSGCDRISELFENSSADYENNVLEENGNNKYAVMFNRVTFGYSEDKPILKDCNFRVENGKKVALIGYTGCGKSTISNLMMKLYEGYQGEIFIKGKDLKTISDTSLKSMVAVSLQEPKIAAGTVYENIIYGFEEGKREDVEELIRLTDLGEFGRFFPEGLDTVVSNSSLTLNQKQIISVLRILNADPDIIIFDETLAGFDSNNNLKIKEKLMERFSDKTIIFIGHDLENFKNMDLIYVLDDGCIEEQGTHDELIKLKKKYYSLYNIQQAGKEI